MALTNNQKEQIAIEVIRTLYSQFDKFPEDFSSNRNAPFQEAFLNAFANKLADVVQSTSTLISLASWMHGLNTSLGQSFLEKTAYILSDGCKKEFTTKKNTTLKISQAQKNIIGDIITRLSNDRSEPNSQEEDNLCFANNGFETDATDFTADVFIEDNDQIICLEIKTVRPNKGIFKNEKQKILEAKSALKNLHPDKEIIYLLGFPFDPLSETQTGYEKERFSRYSVNFRKYFDLDQFLIADEMWDFLSGETNTMETIIGIINQIATPDFLEKYQIIQNKGNNEDYRSLLRDWFMFTELEICENTESISEVSQNNNRLQRLMNQDVFLEGKYNQNRNEILSFIDMI